jgi:hypothetical protein
VPESGLPKIKTRGFQTAEARVKTRFVLWMGENAGPIRDGYCGKLTSPVYDRAKTLNSPALRQPHSVAASWFDEKIVEHISARPDAFLFDQLKIV